MSTMPNSLSNSLIVSTRCVAGFREISWEITIIRTPTSSAIRMYGLVPCSLCAARRDSGWRDNGDVARLPCVRVPDFVALPQHCTPISPIIKGRPLRSHYHVRSLKLKNGDLRYCFRSLSTLFSLDLTPRLAP